MILPVVEEYLMVAVVEFLAVTMQLTNLPGERGRAGRGVAFPAAERHQVNSRGRKPSALYTSFVC